MRTITVDALESSLDEKHCREVILGSLSHSVQLVKRMKRDDHFENPIEAIFGSEENHVVKL